MNIENISPTPTGFVLISLFWILIGAYIVTFTSIYLSTLYTSFYVWFGIIPFMIGIGIILVGWGLFTLRKWAYYCSLIFSLFGTGIMLFFDTFALGFPIINGQEFFFIDIIDVLYRVFLPIVFLLLFLLMVVYLIKNRNYFNIPL